MPNDLVRWNDLHAYFRDSHWNTTEDVINNRIIAQVRYYGQLFELRPRPCAEDFDVYGPAAFSWSPRL